LQKNNVKKNRIKNKIYFSEQQVPGTFDSNQMRIFIKGLHMQHHYSVITSHLAPKT